MRSEAASDGENASRPGTRLANIDVDRADKVFFVQTPDSHAMYAFHSWYCFKLSYHSVVVKAVRCTWASSMPVCLIKGTAMAMIKSEIARLNAGSA